MSRHLQAKYSADHRKKRKRREMEEEEEAEEPVAPPRPAVTNAERMRQYRKRKKLQRENVGVSDACDDAAVAVYPEPVLNIVLEPAPGRSTDPIRFYPNLDPVRFRPDSVGDIVQVESVAFHGKCCVVMCCFI